VLPKDADVRLVQAKPHSSCRGLCTLRIAHASSCPSTTRLQLQLTTHLLGNALLLLLLLRQRRRQRRLQGGRSASQSRRLGHQLRQRLLQRHEPGVRVRQLRHHWLALLGGG
jgi:hypothetical protein